jgi:hypothetical protein
MERGWLRAALLVIATLLAANLTMVVGKHTGRWDATDFFCPYYTLVADHARQGQLLLWTPLVEGGASAGFDPQIGALSPLTVGLAALTGPREFGFRLYWLVVWGLAGIGCLLLARHFGAPVWAGYAAAVGYMFSAIYTCHAEHTAHLVTMSALPWCVWRLDAALVQRRILPGAEAGAIWGLGALSGYPGLVIIGDCHLGMWALGRLLFDITPAREYVRLSSLTQQDGQAGKPDVPHDALAWRGAGVEAHHGQVGNLPHDGRWTSRARQLAAMGAFLAVQLVVLSPAYVGFLVESRGQSDRSGEVPREIAVSAGAMHPRCLATLTSPYLPVLASQSEQRLWPTDASLSGIYLLPACLGLAIAGLWHSPGDRFRWWIAATGLLALACALGEWLPVRAWVYDLLAPTRYFRHSALFRCYYLFSLVVLALWASRDLLSFAQAPFCPDAGRSRDRGPFRDPRSRGVPSEAFWQRWCMVSSVGCVAALSMFATVIASAGIERKTLPVLGLAVGHLMVAWCVPAVVAWRGRPRGPIERRRLLGRVLGASVFLDAVLTIVLSKPIMYTDRSKVWADAERTHNACLDLTAQGLARQRSWKPDQGPENACLLVKRPVLMGYNSFANEYHQKLAADPVLCASAVGEHRLWFSPVAAQAPLDPSTFDRLAARATSHGRPCVVVCEPPASSASTAEAVPENAAMVSPEIGALPAAVPVQATVRKYVGRELALEVDCPEEGWLLVTDRWAPGWRATVNGALRKAWIGNLLFRAVRVDRGPNHVEFVYQPAGYPWLLVASWATLGVVAVASVVSAAWFSRRPSL